MHADVKDMDEEDSRIYMSEIKAYEKRMAGGGDPDIVAEPQSDLMMEVSRLEGGTPRNVTAVASKLTRLLFARRSRFLLGPPSACP